MIIFLLFVVFRIMSVPITEYPFYFTNLCHGSSNVNYENEASFLLLDEIGEPLKCKKINIEQEVSCIESPCPDFAVIRRVTSSDEGIITVPKQIFSDIVYSNVDGPGTVEHSKNKSYLFHSEGNYNGVLRYKDIFVETEGQKSVNLTKQSEQECNHPRSSFVRNYCDGH
jgi:hypothetical protein